jgi:hypothetical protein
MVGNILLGFEFPVSQFRILVEMSSPFDQFWGDGFGLAVNRSFHGGLTLTKNA